jgi:hypothetical protein
LNIQVGKLYKTQISAHKANNSARCRKGKVIARDLRLQTLKRTVSEANSLFNKCQSLKFSNTLVAKHCD